MNKNHHASDDNHRAIWKIFEILPKEVQQAHHNVTFAWLVNLIFEK